jgi:hypothetical protein
VIIKGRDSADLAFELVAAARRLCACSTYLPRNYHFIGLLSGVLQNLISRSACTKVDQEARDRVRGETELETVSLICALKIFSEPSH